MSGIRESNVYVEPYVEQTGHQVIDGVDHTRYELRIHLNGSAHNVYTIFGSRTHPMSIPAAYQEDMPQGGPAAWGADIGGVNAQIAAVFSQSDMG